MYIKNFAAPPATKVTRYTIVYQPYQAASTALKDQRPCNAVYGPTLAPAADKQHIISTAFELSPSKEHMQCGEMAVCLCGARPLEWCVVCVALKRNTARRLGGSRHLRRGAGGAAGGAWRARRDRSASPSWSPSPRPPRPAYPALRRRPRSRGRPNPHGAPQGWFHG